MQSFPTTRWSLFEAVGSGDPDRGQQALEMIITRYSPPLKGHIIRKHLATADDADDLLHEFILNRLLTTDVIRRADKERGRFRHFIRRVLTDFAIDQMRRSRSPVHSPKSLSGLSEAGASVPPITDTADRQFDRDWGKRVVTESIRMMEHECTRVERQDLWEVFSGRLLRPLLENTAPEPYEQMMARLGVLTDTQAQNRLITSKRMFARVVRDVVSEYLFSEREVEDEIRDLFSALSNVGPTLRPNSA